MGPKPQLSNVAHQKQPDQVKKIGKHKQILSLNNDVNRIVIRKQSGSIVQTQMVSLKYLKPPRPCTPGEITIR
jgi:hypothetical protein